MKVYIDVTDNRIKYLKQLLLNNKTTVFDFNFENLKSIEEGDVLVFSPAKKFTIDDVNEFPTNIAVCSGNLTNEVNEVFKQKNIKHINFMIDEVFAYKNAWLTAEGTLAEILLHGQKSLYENKYLLLGFGRCTRALALLLSKLGIEYDVATFTPLHAYQSCIFAKNVYFKYEFLKHLKKYDVVINSMPIKVFEDEMLSSFKEGAIVLEISSTKCLNEENAKLIKYVSCPALPQKYTYKSAAKLIYEKILKEKIL